MSLETMRSILVEYRIFRDSMKNDYLKNRNIVPVQK